MRYTMFLRLLSVLPGVALADIATSGRKLLRQAQAPPAPAPAGSPLEFVHSGLLPHGTPVEIGGQTYKVFHIPQFRPTISPERLNNEMPVGSAVEKQFEKLGPTAPPPRDCVRTPGISNCGCKGMILACHEESYMCEVNLEDLKAVAPGVLRDNYQSKFASPLLNTLELKSRRWKQPASQDAPSATCIKCFQDIAHDLPHNEQDALLQVNRTVAAWSRAGHQGAPVTIAPKAPVATYQPMESGWKIYSGSPDPDAVLAGVCAVDEMSGLEECLSYFWTCDQQRSRLETWVLNTKAKTKYIDEHPGERGQ